MRKLTWLLTLAIGLAGSQGQAQSDANSSVATDRQLLVIYDSSNSMWGELTDSSRKYEAGRNALTTFLGSDLGNRRIGFRAYGHRRESDCNDSELIVPFSDLDSARPQINEAVNDIRPTGKTPITLSLREALGDFAGQPGDVLLISDGIETCDIDPCELMQDWQMADVNIRVHVVGVGLTDVERIAMSCIADTSGGRYFDADSEDGLTVALDNASEAIDEVQNGSGTPEPGNKPYAFRIVATDDQERTYIAKGKLFKGDIELGEVGSHQRNVLEGPGDYRIEVGPLLSDGSIYKPAEKLFTLEGPGEITVNVSVIRPAIVTARFVEKGEEHRGSFVTARQHDQEIFGFRAFDEALARPGSYEFLAEPNADNSLSLSEVLVEGEHTELLFDLVSTVNFYVRFILPDGESFRRGSELWRDGEKRYSVYSGNPTTVKPGIYELRSDDQNLPLTPVDIEIKADGETIEVPIDAGWVTIGYAPSDFDYVGEPDRAWLESLDRGNSKYARVNAPIAVKPGRYRANPHTARGFFEPIDIQVSTNQTVAAIFEPQPLGEIIVNYAPSAHWPKEPDRASVTAVEEQPILNGFMRPGVAKKFLPGRYRVAGGGSSSDAVSQEVVVTAHETVTVTLVHKLD